ncbi:UvrD-helicase domain-containing protein [bacterium]|nr:UvrD-helicase domain-containing protein [bacterium]
MSIERLNKIDITDKDIDWVESVMGTGIHFDEPRRKIIKNLNSVDIQAFPGSGKTTVLVAKLAILAKKWPYSNSGICVLSHTNVAREEIEKRLGNTDVGKKLLKYPHFIGTLQSFFDLYVALPWIHSKGIKLNMIDTEAVTTMRWYELPDYIQDALSNYYHKDSGICCYKNSIGGIDWDKSGKIRDNLLRVIENSVANGYFTFNEMLLYAKYALEKCTSIKWGIQHRFPIIFIDEAQDTNSEQWELIHKILPNDSKLTIMQGFGDCNQAIYNYYGEKVIQHEFPRNEPLVLYESRRFDNRIADFANTVAVSTERMKGTENTFSGRNIKHTIFLFDKENAPAVIDRFGQLILDSFTDEELINNIQEGCHVIGAVHKKKGETEKKHFPKGIYDYWPHYNANIAKINTNYQYFIDYIRIGQIKLQNTGEMSEKIEWISKGLRILLNKGKGENFITATNNQLRNIIKNLPFELQLKFRCLMLNLSNVGINSPEKWKCAINIINNMMDLFGIYPNSTTEKFLLWHNASSDIIMDIDNSQQSLANNYIYKDTINDRTVNLEFGSIHSVKGRTHLATLILETYNKTHNIKAILKFLCNTPPTKITQQDRLKCQYVAMTRAKALLCIAIPNDFVDGKTQNALNNLGWNIEFVI